MTVKNLIAVKKYEIILLAYIPDYLNLFFLIFIIETQVQLEIPSVNILLDNFSIGEADKFHGGDQLALFSSVLSKRNI